MMMMMMMRLTSRIPTLQRIPRKALYINSVTKIFRKCNAPNLQGNWFKCNPPTFSYKL